MRIQLVGSCREGEDKPIKKQFISAGKALGAALVKRGHTIVVGIPRWEYLQKHWSLAEYILLGASEVPPLNGEKHSIIFYAPSGPEPADQTPEPDTVQEFRQLPNIQLEMKPVGGGLNEYGAKLIPNLNEVDAVIMVAGGGGTASIGFASRAMNKPLVTVNSLGGTALALYEDFLSKVLNDLHERKKINDPWVLNAPWYTQAELTKDQSKIEQQTMNAANIVQLTEKVIQAYAQENRGTRITLAATLALTPLLVFLWVMIYLLSADGQIKANYAFFALLWISSLLGTGLQTLIAQREGTSVLTISRVLMDAAISILVAFGLALLYLIGGISFTGNVVILSKEPTSFASIAVSMSLLGLTAGALIPTRQLLERLQKVIPAE